MNYKKLISIKDSSAKKQELQFLEKGVISKAKLQKLINDFKEHYNDIPVNITTEDFDWGDIQWERITVGTSLGDEYDNESKYYLRISYSYAGYIDPETSEISLDIDDGSSWIYEYNGGWRQTSKFEDACGKFMDGQEQEFIRAIRAGFEKYVRSQKKYKKYL